MHDERTGANRGGTDAAACGKNSHTATGIVNNRTHRGEVGPHRAYRFSPGCLSSKKTNDPSTASSSVKGVQLIQQPIEVVGRLGRRSVVPVDRGDKRLRRLRSPAFNNGGWR